MTKLLRTLLALAALIVIVTFAIANRTPVPVSFAPLPTLVELPAYGVFLLGLVLGGLIGGLALWLSGIPQRFRAWRMRKKVSASRTRSRSLSRSRAPRARVELSGAARGRSRGYEQLERAGPASARLARAPPRRERGLDGDGRAGRGLTRRSPLVLRKLRSCQGSNG